MSEFYILQRQPLKEQEWLLDIFSQQDGRLTLVAGPRQRPADALQLMSGSWQAAAEWPQIRAMECRESLPFSGTALYCACYINELLSRLLPRHDPMPQLFHLYHSTLQGLSNGGLPDPWLRLFEVQLLSALGYGFSWQLDDSGGAINAPEHYTFIPRQGFSRTEQGYRGSDILAFVEGQRDNPAAWLAAKKILRQAIDDLLDKPLVSRELIRVSGR